MTEAQRRLRQLLDKQSHDRQRAIELSREDSLTDETRGELDQIELRSGDHERQIRAARLAVESEDEASKVDAVTDADPEQRERKELRSKARLTNYLLAAAQGRLPSGAEAEFSGACQVTGIPVALFGDTVERRAEQRADMPTPSPGSGSVGVNLDPIYPLIFARAVLPRLSVAMPQIGTGTYATATWTTALSAAAKAKGVAQDSTPGAMTVKSSGPHRVSARLSLRLEDVAEIGTENFESSARTQLMLASSAELDRLGLLGDPDTTPEEPQGLLSQQTPPANPPTTVVDFDGFVGLAADAIDGGPWAEGLGDVKLLLNPDTMQLAEKTFQSAASYKGELAAASYLKDRSAGFFSSARMPQTVNTIAQTLRVRSASMGLGGVDAMRLATCGVYAEVVIDDIFSSSAAGIRHYSMHTLITDVLVQQPDAFERVDVKIAT